MSQYSSELLPYDKRNDDDDIQTNNRNEEEWMTYWRIWGYPFHIKRLVDSYNKPMEMLDVITQQPTPIQQQQQQQEHNKNDNQATTTHVSPYNDDDDGDHATTTKLRRQTMC
jgi:hypothetical protein